MDYFTTKCPIKVIYFPMTCDVLTVGHIKCLEWLYKESSDVVIGLLTPEALKGYKKCAMSFEDRRYILESLNINIRVVPQFSLNPFKNLIKYKVTHIASGDGWEPEELKAIKEADCEIIDIQLEGERKGQKLYASSRVKNKIKRICQ